MTETLQLSDYQRRVLAVPEAFDVFLGGGRGGAKSFTLALLALRHAEEHRERARVLYVRRTYKGLADFEAITRDLFTAAYGRAARFNGTEHVWRLPTGAYVELGQLDGPADYGKYQGRSFTLLLVDEAGHYPTPELLDRLRSNLRGPKALPIRMAVAANPGDPGHHWLAARYVFRAGRRGSPSTKRRAAARGSTRRRPSSTTRSSTARRTALSSLRRAPPTPSCCGRGWRATGPSRAAPSSRGFSPRSAWPSTPGTRPPSPRGGGSPTTTGGGW